jgi:hypothetical protein
MSELVAFQSILSSATLLVDFNGRWAIGHVLSSFGFNVETHVGIYGGLAPFWLLWTHYLNMAAWFDQWWIWWCYSSSVVASEDFSRRNQSIEWFCLICCKISTKQPIYRSSFWKSRFGAIQFIIFQLSFDWGFQLAMRYQFICSVIIWVHGRGCCWGWWKFCSSLAFRDTLLGTVGLADLGMDLKVLYFFCDFFWGLGMLKRPELLVCGDIGLVVLSCVGSRRTHPVGVEGATMARRAPFSLSSIPAYVDQSMNLFVCLSLSTTRVFSSFKSLVFSAWTCIAESIMIIILYVKTFSRKDEI